MFQQFYNNYDTGDKIGKLEWRVACGARLHIVEYFIIMTIYI